MPGFPALTPTYGLGSAARTSHAVLISSPRTRLGSQGRIYAFYKSRGEGQQYINYLISTFAPLPRYNPWNVIS